MIHVEMMPTARLVPYARNARTHSDQQIAQIAASMAEFGFVNPILIGDDNVIIAGHGRLMAAQRLGMSEAPVIVLGHPEYYPKFGFSRQAAAKVKSPYAASPAFMALALEEGALDAPLLVAYPDAFGGGEGH